MWVVVEVWKVSIVSSALNGEISGIALFRLRKIKRSKPSLTVVSSLTLMFVIVIV